MIAEVADLAEESGSKKGQILPQEPKKTMRIKQKKMTRCHEGTVNLSQETNPRTEQQAATPKSQQEKARICSCRNTRSRNGTAGTHARGFWKLGEKGKRRPAAATGNLHGGSVGEPNAEAPPAAALIGKEISPEKDYPRRAPCLFLAPSSSFLSLLAASARYHT